MRAKHHMDCWGRSFFTPGFMHSCGEISLKGGAEATWLVSLEEGVTYTGLSVYLSFSLAQALLDLADTLIYFLHLKCYRSWMIAWSWLRVRRGSGDILGVTDMFITLIMLMVSQVYRSHQIMCCKYVQFIICQLHLNKAGQNKVGKCRENCAKEFSLIKCFHCKNQW